MANSYLTNILRRKVTTETVTFHNLSCQIYTIKKTCPSLLFQTFLTNPFLFFFFFICFFNEHSRLTGQQGKGDAISLTPLYPFHSFHRHLDISLTIIAHSQALSYTRSKYTDFYHGHV